MAEVDLATLKKDKAEAEKALRGFNEKGDRTMAKQAADLIKALDFQIKAKGDGVADQGKTMAGKFKALDTLILSQKRSTGEQNKLSAELERMKNKYRLAQQRGEQFDQAQFQAEYDALLAKIRGGK